MSNSDDYRENARNCAELAENAQNKPDRNRFKRMAEAWLLLADGQDWLDGNVLPEKLRQTSK
ncbi:hypothetical protein ACWX0K_25375 (plasmid) [Nitrobacteraceae bacterium UC4446_H13]